MKNSQGKAAFAYERPIYVYPYYLENSPRTFDNIFSVDLLMNLGRRYFMISIYTEGFGISNLEGVDKINSTAEFADYLETVHPFYDCKLERHNQDDDSQK